MARDLHAAGTDVQCLQDVRLRALWHADDGGQAHAVRRADHVQQQHLVAGRVLRVNDGKVHARQSQHLQGRRVGQLDEGTDLRLAAAQLFLQFPGDHFTYSSRLGVKMSKFTNTSSPTTSA